MRDREALVGKDADQAERDLDAALRDALEHTLGISRVDVGDGWSALLLCGSRPEEKVAVLRVLAVAFVADDPTRELGSTHLRAPIDLSAAADEVTVEKFKATKRILGQPVTRDYERYLRDAVRNTRSLARPRRGERKGDDELASIAVLYLEKCREDPRRVLKLLHEHLKKERDWRGLKIETVREYVRAARKRGFLPASGRGRVTCTPTEKLERWLEGQSPTKKRRKR